MSTNERCQSSTGDGCQVGEVGYFRKLYEQEVERRVSAELEVKRMKEQARKLTPVLVVMQIDVGVQTKPVIIVENEGTKTETVDDTGRVDNRQKQQRDQDLSSTFVSSASSALASDSDDEVMVVDLVQNKQIGTPEENYKMRSKGKLWWQFNEKEEALVKEDEEENAVWMDENVDGGANFAPGLSSPSEQRHTTPSKRKHDSPEPPQTQKKGKILGTAAQDASTSLGTVPENPTRHNPPPTNVIPDHIRILAVAGGPPLYQCIPCDKKFGSRRSVLYHQYCGSGEYPFQCEECGKGYANKSHYEIHVRNHTGERPFPCTQCGKRFNRKWNLEKHLIIHKVLNGTLNNFTPNEPATGDSREENEAFLFRQLFDV